MSQPRKAKAKAKTSGLSLERFSQGKVRPTKAVAAKRKRNEKAVQIRKYRKLKEREDLETHHHRPSFYDKTEEGYSEEEKETLVKKEKSHKPDPFFHAKRRAKNAKEEAQEKQQQYKQAQAAREEKLDRRKKQSIRMKVKTKRGQPVIKNRIQDILKKLQE